MAPSVFALLLCALVLPGLAQARTTVACRAPAAVCEARSSGSLALVERGTPLPVLVDDGDAAAVHRAADALRADLAAVAGTASPDTASPRLAVIAGTLGRSARIDRIVRDRKIDTGGVAGTWEAYLLQVVEAPEPGIDRALLVVGADRRGTAFGLYELSRRIGVSPWTWWADVPPPRRDSLHVAPGRFVDAPKVKYRGIFINDEDPALGGWLKAHYGGVAGHRFYERVFQLLMRHKANYLWPAMWLPRAFYDDDARNAEIADEYGIVIATSHHEPMMRAHDEWNRYGKGPWDYTKNAGQLQEFWRGGITRLQSREAVVTMGMRGDGDEAMTEGTATALLERIVADQRRIIAQVTGRPAEQTPQVWALYKEVQDYHDAGMKVPDDLTLLFSDDNWGNIRRLPDPASRRAGGYGVYYHFDYVGGPRNYKWVNSNQVERVWEQMRLAWTHGVEQLWVVNVGDIKPMELPISAFLDQAWDPDAADLDWIGGYPAAWAAEQFGPAQAREIGGILTRYTQLNARRKPELVTPDTWSLVHEGEADRVLGEWDALVERTARVGARIPASHRDAWYQLVEYPVLASANLNHLHVAVGRNRLYAAQGRASANAWAEKARALFARDAELQRVYEQDIAGGKWTGMMAQPRIGYTHWQSPQRNVLPYLSTVDVPEKGVLGVAVEGDARAFPWPLHGPRLPELDPIAAPTREVVVFNRGATPIGFTASSRTPWLKVSPASAEADDAVPLALEVDWNALPEGRHEGRVHIRGKDWTEVTVTVPVHKPPSHRGARGFVEGNGVVAIEAQHHGDAVAPDGGQWQVVPHLGRTLSGVTAWPATGAPATPGGDGAHLAYPLVMDHAGDVEVRVVTAPTLDVRHRGGLRYAVSIGDEAPQVVNMRLEPTPGDRDFRAWEAAVIDNSHASSSRHRVRAGANTLRLWLVDPGLVFQRIEIVRRPLPPTTLGPPESIRR